MASGMLLVHCKVFLVAHGSLRTVACMPAPGDPGTLLRQARLNAALSIRALGKRSGVSPSTISRIEAGRSDPTVGMLVRLLEAAGSELVLSTREAPAPQLQSLHDSLEVSARGDRVDWTRLRAFLDYLTLHPEYVADAILDAPRPSGSALLDNLLAGIAETLADEQGISRPSWTAQVPPLDKGWAAPGTARTLQASREATPGALALRGLTIGRTSLWRAHTSTAESAPPPGAGSLEGGL